VDVYSNKSYNAAEYEDLHSKRVLDMIAKKEQGIQTEPTDFLTPPKAGDIVSLITRQLEEMKEVAA